MVKNPKYTLTVTVTAVTIYSDDALVFRLKANLTGNLNTCTSILKTETLI